MLGFFYFIDKVAGVANGSWIGGSSPHRGVMKGFFFLKVSSYPQFHPWSWLVGIALRSAGRIGATATS